MSSADGLVNVRPDAQEAMIRRLILTHFHAKAQATPTDETVARLMSEWSDEEKSEFEWKFQTVFAAQLEKIRSQGLWDYADQCEQEFFQAGVLETTLRQRIDASWMVESIVCLDWALNRIDELPPYDREAVSDPIRLREGERVRDLIEEAKLRPLSEIEPQREIAELWHWRCRTRLLVETQSIPEFLPDGTSLTDVIQMTAEQAIEDGLFEEMIGNDFPAFGKPFRDLNDEEFQRVMSMSMERHKAWNWLCGYAPGNRWSETPTHT